MVNQFLISIAIIAELLGITLPQALEQDVYVVPTALPEDAIVQAAEDDAVRVTKEADALEYRLFPQTYGTASVPIKVSDDAGPSIEAASALVMDADTGRVLWQQNPDAAVSIASITKLMTALVWLDNQPPDGLDHIHIIAPEEDTPGGKELNLPHGEKLTAFNLLRSSIVGSDNDTALALAHTTGYDDATFVALMNKKARALSMDHARFVDQTGLGSGNVATPYDVAILARAAFSAKHIQEPASMKEHVQETVEHKTFTRVRTTNALLFDQELDIVGAKTGYTVEAGYCIVVEARERDSGRPIIAVILGAPTEHGRFDEAKKLLVWTFEHYAWH